MVWLMMTVEWFSSGEWLPEQGPDSWEVQSMAEEGAVVYGKGRGDPVSGRKAKSGQDGWDQMTKDLGPQRRGLDRVIMQSVGSYAVSVRPWSNGRSVSGDGWEGTERGTGLRAICG